MGKSVENASNFVAMILKQCFSRCSTERRPAGPTTSNSGDHLVDLDDDDSQLDGRVGTEWIQTSPTVSLQSGGVGGGGPQRSTGGLGGRGGTSSAAERANGGNLRGGAALGDRQSQGDNLSNVSDRLRITIVLENHSVRRKFCKDQFVLLSNCKMLSLHCRCIGFMSRLA